MERWYELYVFLYLRVYLCKSLFEVIYICVA